MTYEVETQTGSLRLHLFSEWSRTSQWVVHLVILIELKIVSLGLFLHIYISWVLSKKLIENIDHPSYSSKISWNSIKKYSLKLKKPIATLVNNLISSPEILAISRKRKMMKNKTKENQNPKCSETKIAGEDCFWAAIQISDWKSGIQCLGGGGGCKTTLRDWVVSPFSITHNILMSYSPCLSTHL